MYSFLTSDYKHMSVFIQFKDVSQQEFEKRQQTKTKTASNGSPGSMVIQGMEFQFSTAKIS